MKSPVNASSSDRYRPMIQVMGLASAAAIGLGISRFAYALILPAMQADLGWSFSTAGWLNTTNALGYLAGALLAGRANRSVGPFNAMRIGVWACIASLGLCILLRDPLLLNLARILAGIGAGLAFVAGGVLAARIAARDEANAILLGLFYAGPGFGIAVSGLTVPVALAAGGNDAWPVAWGVLALAAILLAFTLRLGRPEEDEQGSAAPRPRPRLGVMATMLFAYALYGAGYIGYMTFVIAWVREGGAGIALQSATWVLIGIGAMTSPWIWGRAMQKTRNGTAFSMATLVLAFASSLVALSQTSIVLFVSAALFGATFLAVVTSTTAFVRRNLPIEHWTAGIGAMTVAFGIGQILGPVGVGVLTDLTGGVSAGQWSSTLLLCLASLIGFMQRDFARRG